MQQPMIVSRIYKNLGDTRVLERRNWKENEIVLDAGCGSGRITKVISTKVPKGKVFAVDSDLSMITIAKENLEEISNIQYKKAESL